MKKKVKAAGPVWYRTLFNKITITAVTIMRGQSNNPVKQGGASGGNSLSSESSGQSSGGDDSGDIGDLKSASPPAESVGAIARLGHNKVLPDPGSAPSKEDEVKAATPVLTPK